VDSVNPQDKSKRFLSAILKDIFAFLSKLQSIVPTTLKQDHLNLSFLDAFQDLHMVQDGSKNFVPRFWDVQYISSRRVFERNIQNNMGKRRYVEGILNKSISLKISWFYNLWKPYFPR